MADETMSTYSRYAPIFQINYPASNKVAPDSTLTSGGSTTSASDAQLWLTYFKMCELQL